MLFKWKKGKLMDYLGALCKYMNFWNMGFITGQDDFFFSFYRNYLFKALATHYMFSDLFPKKDDLGPIGILNCFLEEAQIYLSSLTFICNST